jgi:ribosomal protein S18 acetylase RimI-like enzyme
MLLEQQVLSKAYFDRQGLIVAEEGGKLVGFAHAGFGPTDDLMGLSTEAGQTAMLMVAPHPSRDAIADQLLARSQQYLRQQGARLLYGGGIFPLNPFYLGLYGGSELPGVLESHRELVELFQRAGYREIDRSVIFHIDLAGFRPIVQRRQLQVRRAYRVEVVFDPPEDNWWLACCRSPAEYTRYQLTVIGGGPVCGQLAVWSMEPLSHSWGVPAAGLVDVRIDEKLRRQGLATHLLGETLRQLRSQGIARVEVQAMQQNVAARGLYQKLGFQEVEQGLVFRKEDSIS